MADPIELSRNVSPFSVVPNATEALKRLLDSYKGLSKRDSLGSGSGCSGGGRDDSETRGRNGVIYRSPPDPLSSTFCGPARAGRDRVFSRYSEDVVCGRGGMKVIPKKDMYPDRPRRCPERSR